MTIITMTNNNEDDNNNNPLGSLLKILKNQRKNDALSKYLTEKNKHQLPADLPNASKSTASLNGATNLHVLISNFLSLKYPFSLTVGHEENNNNNYCAYFI